MVACHLFARQAVSLLSLLTTLIGAEAAGAEPGVPAMSTRRTDVRPFEYVDVGNRIPNYLAGQEWGTQGEAFSKMQLPLEPAESLKHLVTPVDFEARLFAAEPHIRRPICMNWDERGRLWVAESVDYPNSRQGPGQGHDRIVICEDTDGDGVADKFTVFADKLSIPTGFTFYKGGVLVVQAPDTLYLKDTDGDGIADERRVLFSGWGTRDSHAGPSNLRWGFDNWVYGICGYAGFNDRYVDLRVDDHPEPIEELARILDLHKLYFFKAQPEDVLEIDSSLAAELSGLLARAGFLSAGAPFDEDAYGALVAFMHRENLEDRVRHDGCIDRQTLEYLRTFVASK